MTLLTFRRISLENPNAWSCVNEMSNYFDSANKQCIHLKLFLLCFCSFCPALTVISDTLNLSPNVAGVTFLALGGGVPDIFTGVASFVNSSSAGNLALSSFIGKLS